MSAALAVAGYGQTESVLVGTNGAIAQPTNFWQANASNARSGIGLGSAATNPETAFQPASSALTNIASGNGGALTNLKATNIIGQIPASNISSVSVSNITGVVVVGQGGTGATNAGTARTNLGITAIGEGVFTATNTETVRVAIGLPLGALTNTNTAGFREAISLGWSALTNTKSAGFISALWGKNQPVLADSNGVVTSPTNLWTTNADAIRSAAGLYTNTNGETAVQWIYDPVEANGVFSISDGNATYSGENPVDFADTMRDLLYLKWNTLTNTNATGFQSDMFATNAAPTNTNNVNTVDFNTAVHWLEVTVKIAGTNQTLRIPLFQ